IIISINIFNYDNAVDTIGTITSISTSHKSNGDTSHIVYVTYNVDGNAYESRLNSYSSSFYEGKTIDIYYDQNNPHKIGVKSMDLVFLVFPAVGLIFLVIGGSVLIVKKKKSNLEKRLKENGTAIYATYVETIMDTSLKVNGKSPYNIICEWSDPSNNQKYIFKSKNIWFNPENTIAERNIQQFPVYIDPSNIKKYAVDVESLLENVVDLS
ncbi:MAG: DUF3592 domain-containing protein, partial [Bacilli bacterium]|nr:DUF3592 domain-containing protein [Bacilli bacterium]